MIQSVFVGDDADLVASILEARSTLRSRPINVRSRDLHRTLADVAAATLAGHVA